MSEQTRLRIMQHARRLFARYDYAGVSMRDLAKASGLSLSVAYHYFKDKDVLLKEILDTTGTELGIIRAALPPTATAAAAMRQRIRFQFDHAEEVVFVLKYYLHFREAFRRVDLGFIPPKAYLHIEEVLERGVASGEFRTLDIPKEAKVIAHAINGFVLEYYPATMTPAELDELVDDIATFIVRSIEKR
jgi:AcrR family transcriptional regulator